MSSTKLTPEQQALVNKALLIQRMAMIKRFADWLTYIGFSSVANAMKLEFAKKETDAKTS